MDTPKKIWLIDIGEGDMIWADEGDIIRADEHYPDGGKLEEDLVEYRLSSDAQAEIDALNKNAEYREQTIQQQANRLNRQQAEIDRLKEDNFKLASWQCLYLDGKQGIVCDDGGGQYCAKQAEIDELVDMLEYFYEYGYERLKAEKLLRKHKGE